MSKINLTPNASGTGVFTIASPNSNTDRTINLPDVDGAVITTQSPQLGRRNLIINGAMQVAQRGTSVTGVTTAGYYTVDRFEYHKNGGLNAVVGLEQVSDAPGGFDNSLKLTVETADVYGAGDYSSMFYKIEGYDMQRLGFGTPNAQPFTLSFWVKTSVAGEYAVAFQNEGNGRTFMKTFTVNSPNTWEYKTLTIPADTGGTWNKENLIGLKVWISLGVGSTFAAPSTLSAWQSGLVLGSTNGVKLLETSGATWQITGVQLEIGDTATPFEHRSYGEELALCQRYYSYLGGTAYQGISTGMRFATTGSVHGIQYPVTMRAAPSVSHSDLILTDRTIYDEPITGFVATTAGIGSVYIRTQWSTARGSIGDAAFIAVKNGTNGRITFDAEL